jgi:hypothetical protein
MQAEKYSLQPRTPNAKYFALWIMVGSRKKSCYVDSYEAKRNGSRGKKCFMYENIPYNLFLAYLSMHWCSGAQTWNASMFYQPLWLLPSSSYGENSSRYAASSRLASAMLATTLRENCLKINVLKLDMRRWRRRRRTIDRQTVFEAKNSFGVDLQFIFICST